MTVSQIRELLTPKSIAILGAGNNLQKMGTHHALSIINDGFKGRVYPIHPKEKTVLGINAYQRIADLPEVPDLALFIIPAVHVPGLLEEFGKLGTKYAVIITAGFKETGQKGIALENRIKAIAETYHMRFVGPNCIGVINSDISMNTTVHPMARKPGGLGLISQSGTYVAQSLTYLEERGIRFSKAVSVGNETSVSLTDVLEYMGEDEKTKAIALYIEGVRDVRRFLETARRISKKKPIVAQYTGGSGAGARSSLGHTGAMAGPDHLYDGLFAQAGIIRVDTIQELYWTGWTLATQPPMKGNRVGIVTNSGGPGSAIANECEKGGLDVPGFSEGLREQLKGYLASHAPCGNPVDLTFSMDLKRFGNTIPQCIARSGEVDGMIIHGLMQTGPAKIKYPHLKPLLNGISLEDMVKYMETDPNTTLSLPDVKMPFLVSSFYGAEDNCIKTCLDNDIPVFRTPEHAARAMAALYRYHGISVKEPYRAPELPAPLPEATRLLTRARKQGQLALSEFEAKRLLHLYGLPVTREILAFSQDEAKTMAGRIGFPVVVKACDPSLLHKTEHHLVHLNLNTKEEVGAAYQKIIDASRPDMPVLVAEMVKGPRELVAGVIQDPQMGTWVMFGLGGVFTEVVKDNTFRLAPVSLPEAREMITDIRGKIYLKAFRGMPAVKMGTLASLMFRLSLMSVCHPEIREIDVNPIIIREDAPMIVDALVALSPMD